MSSAALSPQARRDLNEAARWIAQDNPVAARALRISVQKAARVLGEHPRAGRERLDVTSRPVRFFALAELPYIIVYNAEVSPPLIARVLHEARDLPGVLALS